MYLYNGIMYNVCMDDCAIQGQYEPSAGKYKGVTW